MSQVHGASQGFRCEGETVQLSGTSTMQTIVRAVPTTLINAAPLQELWICSFSAQGSAWCAQAGSDMSAALIYLMTSA